MKCRILKQTDLELSELGFGVWGISTNWWGHVDEVEAVRLLQRADDLGINFSTPLTLTVRNTGSRFYPKPLVHAAINLFSELSSDMTSVHRANPASIKNGLRTGLLSSYDKHARTHYAV